MLRTRPRRLAALSLGAVAVAATALIHVGSAHAESNGGVRVMPLGDSITDGVPGGGGYRVGLWQRFIQGGYLVDFVGSQFNGPASLGDHDHQGHSGWRIDQIDANVVGWLRTQNPRTVLLHIGTNDIAQNRDLPNAPNRLSALIDKITTTVPNADVFVATIIPLPFADAQVRSFNAAIPGIVQSKVNAGRHVHLVDMYPRLTAADLADGVHPNATGYDKMAAAWYAALRSVPGSLGNGPTTAPTTPPTTRATTPTTRPTTPPTTPVTRTQTPPTTVSTPNTATGGCTASYAIVGQWPGGFQGSVTVTAGSAAISAWTVSWTFPNGQSIQQSWSATVTPNGSTVTARNVAYNGALGAGASTQFGFIASWNGSNGPPAGLTCTAS